MKTVKNAFQQKENYWTIQTTNSYSNKLINIYKKKEIFSNQIIKEFSNILDLNQRSFKAYKYMDGNIPIMIHILEKNAIGIKNLD